MCSFHQKPLYDVININLLFIILKHYENHIYLYNNQNGMVVESQRAKFLSFKGASVFLKPNY